MISTVQETVGEKMGTPKSSDVKETNEQSVSNENETALDESVPGDIPSDSESKSGEPSDEDLCTVWVGQLHRNVTEEILYELFLQAGPIVSARIPSDKDGTKRSFGFIVYVYEITVPYAIALFEGTKLCGRELRLNSRNMNRIDVEQIRREMGIPQNSPLRQKKAPSPASPSKDAQTSHNERLRPQPCFEQRPSCQPLLSLVARPPSLLGCAPRPVSHGSRGILGPFTGANLSPFSNALGPHTHALSSLITRHGSLPPAVTSTDPRLPPSPKGKQKQSDSNEDEKLRSAFETNLTPSQGQEAAGSSSTTPGAPESRKDSDSAIGQKQNNDTEETAAVCASSPYSSPAQRPTSPTDQGLQKKSNATVRKKLFDDEKINALPSEQGSTTKSMLQTEHEHAPPSPVSQRTQRETQCSKSKEILGDREMGISPRSLDHEIIRSPSSPLIDYGIVESPLPSVVQRASKIGLEKVELNNASKSQLLSPLAGPQTSPRMGVLGLFPAAVALEKESKEKEDKQLLDFCKKSDFSQSFPSGSGAEMQPPQSSSQIPVVSVSSFFTDQLLTSRKHESTPVDFDINGNTKFIERKEENSSASPHKRPLLVASLGSRGASECLLSSSPPSVGHGVSKVSKSEKAQLSDTNPILSSASPQFFCSSASGDGFAGACHDFLDALRASSPGFGGAASPKGDGLGLLAAPVATSPPHLGLDHLGLCPSPSALGLLEPYPTSPEPSPPLIFLPRPRDTSDTAPVRSLDSDSEEKQPVMDPAIIMRGNVLQRGGPAPVPAPAPMSGIADAAIIACRKVLQSAAASDERYETDSDRTAFGTRKSELVENSERKSQESINRAMKAPEIPRLLGDARESSGTDVAIPLKDCGEIQTVRLDGVESILHTSISAQNATICPDEERNQVVSSNVQNKRNETQKGTAGENAYPIQSLVNEMEFKIKNKFEIENSSSTLQGNGRSVYNSQIWDLNKVRISSTKGIHSQESENKIEEPMTLSFNIPQETNKKAKETDEARFVHIPSARLSSCEVKSEIESTVKNESKLTTSSTTDRKSDRREITLSSDLVERSKNAEEDGGIDENSRVENLLKPHQTEVPSVRKEKSEGSTSLSAESESKMANRPTRNWEMIPENSKYMGETEEFSVKSVRIPLKQRDVVKLEIADIAENKSGLSPPTAKTTYRSYPSSNVANLEKNKNTLEYGDIVQRFRSGPLLQYNNNDAKLQSKEEVSQLAEGEIYNSQIWNKNTVSETSKSTEGLVNILQNQSVTQDVGENVKSSLKSSEKYKESSTCLQNSSYKIDNGSLGVNLEDTVRFKQSRENEKRIKYTDNTVRKDASLHVGHGVVSGNLLFGNRDDKLHAEKSQILRINKSIENKTVNQTGHESERDVSLNNARLQEKKAGRGEHTHISSVESKVINTREEAKAAVRDIRARLQGMSKTSTSTSSLTSSQAPYLTRVPSQAVNSAEQVTSKSSSVSTPHQFASTAGTPISVPIQTPPSTLTSYPGADSSLCATATTTTTGISLETLSRNPDQFIAPTAASKIIPISVPSQTSTSQLPASSVSNRTPNQSTVTVGNPKLILNTTSNELPGTTHTAISTSSLSSPSLISKYNQLPVTVATSRRTSTPSTSPTLMPAPTSTSLSTSSPVSMKTVAPPSGSVPRTTSMPGIMSTPMLSSTSALSKTCAPNPCATPTSRPGATPNSKPIPTSASTSSSKPAPTKTSASTATSTAPVDAIVTATSNANPSRIALESQQREAKAVAEDQDGKKLVNRETNQQIMDIVHALDKCKSQGRKLVDSFTKPEGTEKLSNVAAEAYDSEKDQRRRGAQNSANVENKTECTCKFTIPDAINKASACGKVGEKSAHSYISSSSVHKEKTNNINNSNTGLQSRSDSEGNSSWRNQPLSRVTGKIADKQLGAPRHTADSRHSEPYNPGSIIDIILQNPRSVKVAASASVADARAKGAGEQPPSDTWSPAPRRTADGGGGRRNVVTNQFKMAAPSPPVPPHAPTAAPPPPPSAPTPTSKSASAPAPASVGNQMPRSGSGCASARAASAPPPASRADEAERPGAGAGITLPRGRGIGRGQLRRAQHSPLSRLQTPQRLPSAPSL